MAELLDDDEREWLRDPKVNQPIDAHWLDVIARAALDYDTVPGLWAYLRSNGWGEGIDPQTLTQESAMKVIVLMDPFTVLSLVGEVLRAREAKP